MSRRFRKPPSEVLHVEDEYTAYCLDEACDYILDMISSGQEPIFERKCSSFTEMYAKYDQGGGSQ